MDNDRPEIQKDDPKWCDISTEVSEKGDQTMKKIATTAERTAHDRFTLPEVRIKIIAGMGLMSEEAVNTPEAAVKILAKEIADYDREVLAAVNLDVSCRPINYTVISTGTINSSLIHPREIIKSAILSNAASIILMHNHPSGSLKPSKEDIQVTDRMNQVCELCGIMLMDHIIVIPGSETYFSFRENRVLEKRPIQYKDNLDEGSILKNN